MVLSESIIDSWFKKDWSKSLSAVENNESTKDLGGGQKEAMADFVFNGLRVKEFKKGDDEKFFLGFLKGERGTFKKRIGQLILFKDNTKVNLDFIDNTKQQQQIEKQLIENKPQTVNSNKK